jgi:glycosyltransferase involved in cell wall biosynthesis
MKDINTDLLLSTVYQKSGDFDLIHSHLNERHFFFSPFAKCPTVVTQHWPIEENARIIIENSPQDNVWVVPISNAQRKQGEGLLNYTRTVYNGLDPDKFKFYDQPQDHFIFLSRLVPEKGAHNAIAAAKKLGAKLEVYGKTKKAAKYQTYWQKIKSEFDDKLITYHGEAPYAKVNQYFGQARAFLFPIEWEEAFGLVMIEAMASGTPVIAFNRGSVPEIVKDGETGFVVENVDQMAEAMKKIDQIDRAACRKHVEENFSIAKMVAGYEEVYKDIVNK